MKRSRINRIMAEADDLIRSHGFTLPPFARWTPDEFRARRDDARHVIDARISWQQGAHISKHGRLVIRQKTIKFTVFRRLSGLGRHKAVVGTRKDCNSLSGYPGKQIGIGHTDDTVK